MDMGKAEANKRAELIVKIKNKILFFWMDKVIVSKYLAVKNRQEEKGSLKAWLEIKRRFSHAFIEMQGLAFMITSDFKQGIEEDRIIIYGEDTKDGGEIHFLLEGTKAEIDGWTDTGTKKVRLGMKALKRWLDSEVKMEG